MSVIRQLSLFGVEAATPEPGDLVGLLAGPGEIAWRGDLVRLSIVVDHPWRAAALVAECARRGIAATSVSTMDEHTAVRTAHSVALKTLALAWTAGSVKRAPHGLTLDGRALRLWAVAGGHFVGGSSYALPLGSPDEALGEPIGTALAALGLPAQLASPRSRKGVSYRIVGQRRLRRLAELIGDPPKQAPPDAWPS